MAIERRTFLYEVLVRLGPDGFQGAHVVDLERVVDTDSGEIIAEREGAPRPLTEAEVGPIIGTASAGLIEAAAQANAARNVAETALADALARLAELAPPA